MVLFCLLAIGGPGLAQAQAQSEYINEARAVSIIRLQHRDTKTISEAIKPLLANGASLGQMDNALIIATTAANLIEIEHIIDQLDIPRRSLLVSVDFNYPSSNSVGNDLLQTGTPAERQIQRIRLLEGEQAMLDQSRNQINTGVNVFNPGLTISQEQQESRRLILLSAEFINEQLILDMNVLTAERTRLADNASRQLATRISVEPGEWLVINPADESTTPENVETISTRNDTGLIAVRVELQP